MDALDGKPSRNKRDYSTLQTKLGTRIETKTAADAQKIAGFSPNGIVICEAAQVSYEIFLRCIQRVSQSRGWVLAIGTFESSVGWYAELWESWQAPNSMGGKSFSMPTWSNLHIFPGGREDTEIKRLEMSMTEERFLERVGAIPCPPSTVVFHEFKTTKHVPGYIDYNPDLPVFLSVDPGYAEAYSVVAIQELHDKVWIVDEVYVSGKSGREVIDICRSRKWFKSVEAIYMDIASRQHHADYSQEELWYKEVGMRPILRKLSIQDGIDIYHRYLSTDESGSPRMLFSNKCYNTIKEHFNYQYPTNKDRAITSEIPIDRHNHSIKAISYFLSNRKSAKLTRLPSYTGNSRERIMSELYA